jgi:hypothetical protein
MHWIAKLIGHRVLEDAYAKWGESERWEYLHNQRRETGKPMDKKLQDKLLRRFPYLYRGYYKDMQSTCMCWGFACGDGWFRLLWVLSLAIEEELGYSWFKKQKYLWMDVAAARWNKAVRWLFYKLYLPKKIREASQSSWMSSLPKEDHKDRKKVEAAVRHMRAGQKLEQKCWKKFLKLPFMRMWHPYTGFQVEQVKEKFGTLRFYVSGYTDEIHEFIHMAEELSYITCEKCGATTAKQRGRGWIYTACKDCVKDPFDYTKEEMREWKEKYPMDFLKFIEKHDLKPEDFEEGVLDEN